MRVPGLAGASPSLNLCRIRKPTKPQRKMRVAAQLARKSVGTTKMSAIPMAKKEKVMETRRPKNRQVDTETRIVVAAKARKRANGMPVSAV
jgi:hypothetical protein